MLPMMTILASMPWSSYLDLRYGSVRGCWAIARGGERTRRRRDAPRLTGTASRIGTDGPARFPFMDATRDEPGSYSNPIYAVYSCAVTGNSNTTSLPVSRRYTDVNESSLYSNDVASFASRNLRANRVSTTPTVHTESQGTHTFSSFDPSVATRVRLPTISVGNTRSSRIRSWTLVSVRLRGLFCFTREVRVGLRSIRRCATNTTWRSENFFSSSRVSLSERVSAAPPVHRRNDMPLLHLAEGLQLWDGDKDDDGLLAATDVDFAGSRYLEGSQFRLEFRHVVFQIDQSLRDAGLELVGRCLGCISGALYLVCDGHGSVQIAHHQSRHPELTPPIQGFPRPVSVHSTAHTHADLSRPTAPTRKTP